MKRIEDIKEFEDIDTYYEISKMVDKVFQDRVEAHKHLVTANKEIERLNNIINELEKWLKEKNKFYEISTMGYSYGVTKEVIDKLQELKGEKE